MSLAAQQPPPPASTNQQYLNSETFHTPSFGDDDFNLPPLGMNGVTQVPEPVQNGGYMPSQQNQQMCSPGDPNYNYQSHSPPQQQHQQYIQNGGYPNNGYMNNPHTGLLAPKFPPPQTFDAIPDISNSYNQGSYVVSSSAQQQHHFNNNNNPSTQSHLQRHSNNQNYFVTPSHPVSGYPGMHPHQGQPGPYGMARPPMSGYAAHNGIHPGPPGGLTRMHNGMMSASPTGSNNTSSPGRESGSEESSSDDSVQNGLKRGASEMTSPTPPVTVAKKPKTPKKRKKKDPNEPQKPVSAYALFFRDTQAAIKGQNPNASFGEVSKIVASMWDNLDATEKANYKKRTENAKKEYLKQLAAYRASLVSQQNMDPMGGVVHSSAGSIMTPPPPRTMSSPIGAPPLTHMPPPGAPQMGAHPQGMMMPPPPPHHTQSLPGQPKLTPLAPRPPQHHGSGPQGTPLGMSPPGGGMGGPNQPPHMGQHPNMSPMSQGGNYGGQPGQGQGQQQSGSPGGMCVRNGCNNPSMGDGGWGGGGDSEYCSNDCVVNNCRDVFTAWVASRQNTSNSSSYASVK